jgi:hypothetical protein
MAQTMLFLEDGGLCSLPATGRPCITEAPSMKTVSQKNGTKIGKRGWRWLTHENEALLRLGGALRATHELVEERVVGYILEHGGRGHGGGSGERFIARCCCCNDDNDDHKLAPGEAKF